MAWRPYATCCHREALATDSAFCPECGRSLIRCMAFSECFSLVAPMQPCPVCIAPQLAIEKDAVLQAKVGERLSIPLVLRNASQVERPISVISVVKAEAKSFEPVDLTWEHLDPGGERGFALTTESFAQGGPHAIGVIVTLASRYKGREEQYAYAGSVNVAVDSQEQQIVQHINLSGAQFATGGMVHAPVSARSPGGSGPVALREREPVTLQRAERYEIERGVRGYAETAVRAPRHVSFTFVGFPAGDHPDNGAGFGMGGALNCGRNSRRYDAATNPFPSDLSLRIYDPRTGAVDEDATRSISRHHLDFLVLNDRLCVQARSNGGLEHNGRRLGPGEISVVRHGDRLAPLAGHPEKLALIVSLRASTGTVEQIEIAREPRMKP